ncbi:AAA family ATPase [Micromonospora arborensis]|uniref:AAA family ATPase n=1 Tax=Micromonospora arborensis TaxID=2116518 RepID=UPI003445FC1E
MHNGYYAAFSGFPKAWKRGSAMTEPRRYVLTGAPGAGKTTLIEALSRRGHLVVREAATDIIATRQAEGCAEPPRSTGSPARGPTSRWCS